MALPRTRIAIAVAARAVFMRGELVVAVVGIALGHACLVIDQCLDARHDWRGHGGAERPLVRFAFAVRTGAQIAVAPRICVPPWALGSEQRHVGEVAHAIVRNAEHARLPGGLRVSGAGAADDARYGGRTGGAAARPATSRPRLQQASHAAGAIAGARGAVRGREPLIHCEKPTGTGVVPRNFRHVRLGRAPSRRVGRAPIGAVGSGIGIAEIGAADGDVVGCGGKPVYIDPVRRHCRLVVALRGALVTRRHED